MPRYYLTGRGCWDCTPGNGWPVGGRRAAATDCIEPAVDHKPGRRPPAVAAPALSSAAVASLPPRQAIVYAALAAGLGVRAIAKRDGVTPAAVSRVAAKLRRRSA